MLSPQLHPYRNGSGQNPSATHRALILALLWHGLARPLAIETQNARKVAT